MANGDNQWHLDKRVNIGIIAAILIQTGSMFYWGGMLENRVSNLERGFGGTSDRGERIARVETELTLMRQALQRIDQKLDIFSGAAAR